MKCTKGMAKKALGFATKNAPTILTGLSVVGMYATTILAVRATPKALQVIEEKKKVDGLTKLSVKETVVVTWQEYIPTILVSVVTTFCIVKSHRIHMGRQAALMALYSMTETAMREYQGKVREIFGAKKEEKVRDAVNKDRILRQPSETSPIVITGMGGILCYDAPSKRYFKSDIEKIRRKENEFNMDLRTEMELTLNDLYFELGLEQTKLGDFVGWQIDKDILLIHYSSQLSDDGTPCLVLDYDVHPLGG